MSGQRVIALLGRPDAPTDAVEEYCRYLGEAMTAEGFELIIERVTWPQDGSTRAAKGLRRRAKRWRGAWVLVQYTALAWSARGFPLRFPRLLSILKAAQVRVGVVFHDVEPYGGTRAIDRLRRHAQSAEAELRQRFQDGGVELHVMGVLPGEDVVRSLSISDVLLFVRGHISTRRGSAIAGIACGLPVVASAGSETAAPITEAGLALFSPQRKGDLGDVLLRVLEDEHYRASLAQQSWVAQQQYFSWPAIAARYAEFMRSLK